MKKLIVLLFIVKLGVFSAFVQAQEGIKIDYEFIDENPELQEAKRTPGNLVMNFGFYALEGNNSYSKFSEVKDLRYENRMNEIAVNLAGVKKMFSSVFYSGTFYTDFVKNKVYDKTSLEGKPILVPDTLQTLDWKLQRVTKKILNFDVRLAKYEDDAKIVEAWYAPQLPFKIGPLNYNGLPGAILDITVRFKEPKNKSIKHLFATNVEYLNKVDFALPKNLKVVSKEVYSKKMKELRKKHSEMYSQGVETDD